MNATLLEVLNLQPLNSEGDALAPQLSFQLLPGEVLFLRGENGSGKSTLLKTLLGLHRHFKGSFQHAIDPSQIQYLPQLSNIGFHLPMSLADMSPSVTQPSSLLKNLDLRKKWNTASGGERQKTLLAEILAQKPRLLILDEPFNHVDTQTAEDLEEALADYLKDNPQSSLILVSHRAVIKDFPRVQFVELK